VNDKTDRIRKKAHEIWESEGRPHGRHDYHWDEASRQIESEDAALVKPKRAASAKAATAAKAKAPAKPKAAEKPKDSVKPKTAGKPAVKAEERPAAKADAKIETKPAAKAARARKPKA
jgi:hypothetical protein